METILAELWILLPILYLGVITSIQDWKEHKIYQKHVLFGLAIGVIWLAAWGLYNGVFYQNWQILTIKAPLVLLSALISFVVGFVMWWFNVWSAADAKLFAVYTLLLPVSLYTHHTQHFYSFLILLVNTYTAAFFIITADFLFKAGKRALARLREYSSTTDKERRQSRQAAGQWLREQGPMLLRTALGIMFILLVYRLMRQGVQDELEQWFTVDRTLLILFLFLAFRPLHRLFQHPVIFVMILLGIAGHVAYEQHLNPGWQSLSETLSIGLMSLVLLLFRQIYAYWSKTMETQLIPVETLEENMVVSEATLEMLNDQDLFSEIERKAFSADGINDEQCKRIREHFVHPQTPGMIEVETTIAFAPFLFGGLVLSVLAQGIFLRFQNG